MWVRFYVKDSGVLVDPLVLESTLDTSPAKASLSATLSLTVVHVSVAMPTQYVSTRQHAPAHASTRQHTPAHASARQRRHAHPVRQVVH